MAMGDKSSISMNNHSERGLIIDNSTCAIDLLVATAQYGTLTRSHLNDHDMKSTRSNHLDLKSSAQVPHGSDLRHLASTESHTTHAYSSSGSSGSNCYHTTQNHHDSSGGSNSSSSGSGSNDGGSSNSEADQDQDQRSATGSTSDSESVTRVRVDRQSVKPSHVLSTVNANRDRSVSATEESTGYNFLP